MVLVGAVLTWVLHHGLAGRLVWSLAGFLFLLGMVWPGGYRPVHAFGQRLGRGVGGLLLYLLLAPFFLLFFFPVGLILRLVKRDPLQRFHHAPGETYWISRPARDRDTNIADQFFREDRDARLERRPVGTSAWAGHEENA